MESNHHHFITSLHYIPTITLQPLRWYYSEPDTEQKYWVTSVNTVSGRSQNVGRIALVVLIFCHSRLELFSWIERKHLSIYGCLFWYDIDILGLILWRNFQWIHSYSSGRNRQCSWFSPPSPKLEGWSKRGIYWSEGGGGLWIDFCHMHNRHWRDYNFDHDKSGHGYWVLYFVKLVRTYCCQFLSAHNRYIIWYHGTDTVLAVSSEITCAVSGRRGCHSNCQEYGVV